jgi:hypothetical protein
MNAYDTPEKIFDWAYWPNFELDIEYLASLANSEEWKPQKITPVPLGEKENYYYKFSENHPTLASYILNTYKRIIQEGILERTSDLNYAYFNTGLFSSREQIYAVFENNNKVEKQYWKFSRFCIKNDRQLLSFGILPKMCDYTKIQSDLIFTPNKSIIPNISHILEDHSWRFPPDFQSITKIGKENLLDGAIHRAEDNVKQTPGLAVPQYYKGGIQLLIPLQLMSDNPEVALVLDTCSDLTYRANTVFPLDWAYMNARVITKPSVNWLAS